MKMPFGKHKGAELEDIIENHTGYFIWLTSITDTLREPLKSEVYRLHALPSTLSQIEFYEDSLERDDYRNGHAYDNIDIEDDLWDTPEMTYKNWMWKD